MREASKQNHPYRILVVEDDPEMRALLTDELSDEGYAVTQAVDGADASLKVAHETFDLVITDMKMPNLGGLEFLPIVEKSCPGVPVLVITAFGDWPSFIEAYDKGAVDFISKPFKMLELKNAVKKALNNKTGSNGGKTK